MQIPVQQFPILSAEQANPFHQALQTGLQNYTQGIKAVYAPLQIQADAASKLAYARLMGPQFAAKLFGNEGVLANVPESQKHQVLQLLLQAGTGNTGISGLPGNIGGASSWGTAGSGSSPISNPQQNPSLGNASSENSGYSYDANGNNVVASPDEINQAAEGKSQNTSSPNIGDIASLYAKSPDATEKLKKNGSLTIPSSDQLLDWYKSQQSQPASIQSQPSSSLGYSSQAGAPQKGKTYAENTANYKNILSEGEELGKIRAKDIGDLSTTYRTAVDSKTTLNAIGDILADPALEQIRQLPLASQHELAYYAKEGTRAQQQLIGNYYTLTGNIIKDSARDFAGQFRTGEQTLLTGMKPNPADTIDVAKGKAESLSYLNQMKMNRAKIAIQLMQQQHMNSADAMSIADQKVNGAAVRQQVRDRLNPKVTVVNRKTGQRMTIPVDQARQLGVPNV